MLFNSLAFLVFFPLVTASFFLLPHRYRAYMLVVASCVFYMWFVPAYILILLVTIVADYFAAIWIAQSQGRRRQAALAAALIFNFAFLFVFKYFNFFNENLELLSAALGFPYTPLAIKILLPIGLSFHTFQSASYLIEVHRGVQEPVRNPVLLSLFILYWPQLVAGPIERPANLLPQLTAEQRFDYDRAMSGLKLMLWGFFKKLVVADRLSMYVDAVYGQPTEFSGAPLLIATYFFAVQIYCDFSGYSDIAIGSARVMGVKLMINFETPHFSTSFTEFWRRWHISLSTWFRDYVYIPLGGSRTSEFRACFNIMVVFLTSGLWHGASWNYVLFGGIHGFFLVVERVGGNLLGLNQRRNPTMEVAVRPSRARRFFGGLWHVLRVLLVFHIGLVAWVFFRAKNMSDVYHVFTHVFEPTQFDPNRFLYEPFYFKIGVLAIGLLLIFELLQASSWVREHLPRIRRYGLHYAFYAAMLVIIFAMGVFQGGNFIYFQF